MIDVGHIPELDNKFLADNLLTSDDWEGHLSRLDDIPDILDFDPSFCTDEWMTQIQGDLDSQIPMLYEDGFPIYDATTYDCNLNGCDSEDSGISVKQEPLSPAPSFSSDSESSSQTTASLMDYQVYSPPIFPDYKLESPPLTPPHLTTYTTLQSGNTVSVNNLTNNNSAYKTMVITSDTKSPQIQVLNNLSSHKGSPTITRSLINPKTTSLIGGSTKQHHILSVPKQNVNAPPVVTVKLENGILDASNKNFDKILNNKVKIIPKPSLGSASATGKPLVLTAEEFAKLTSQGVLTLTPSVEEDKKCIIPVTTNRGIINQNNIPPDYESKVQKRQQRMIKNRESACLSRKRKKDYLNSVEDKLHQYNRENERLKQENHCLKRKVEMLSSENERLKMVTMSNKKSACLMACLLFLTLNLGSVSLNSMLVYNEKPTSGNIPISEVHHGRTLMSVTDRSKGESQAQQANITKFQKTVNELRRTVLRENGTREEMQLLQRLEILGALGICSTKFNSTESDRLTNELTGWVLGHKKEAMKMKMTEEEQRRSQFLKKFAKRRPKKTHTGKLIWNKSHRPSHSGQNFEVQLFNHQERDYYDFMDVIQRRNDTFYVVSFRHDHLLLPAIAHNKTMRPKMSLVMPAVTLNETLQPPHGSVAMMQIDCEVTNTRLLHVTKSVIPNEDVEKKGETAPSNQSRSNWKKTNNP